MHCQSLVIQYQVFLYHSVRPMCLDILHWIYIPGPRHLPAGFTVDSGANCPSQLILVEFAEEWNTNNKFIHWIGIALYQPLSLYPNLQIYFARLQYSTTRPPACLGISASTSSLPPTKGEKFSNSSNHCGKISSRSRGLSPHVHAYHQQCWKVVSHTQQKKHGVGNVLVREKSPHTSIVHLG